MTVTLSELAQKIQEWGERMGWNDNRTFGDHIALMHSELSEALEEWRDGHGFKEVYYSGEDSKPEGIPIELADVIIRILHVCVREGINIEGALVEKMAYNETRKFRHGGKRM